MITKQSASIYFKEKEKRAVRTIGQMVATFTATKKEDKTKTAYHIFAYEGIQTLVNKMPADTKSVLVIDDIGCQLIKEFIKKGITDITYCCTVNDKNLFDRIVYYIKNVFSSYSLKFKMIGELKDMEFDYIVANPPYSIGNGITKFVVENVKFKKYVNLMPLSCYMDNMLYKDVANLELADPKWFEDADITDNLCICDIMKNAKKYSDYTEISLISYDQDYIEFYVLNGKCKESYQYIDVPKLGTPLYPETDFYIGMRTNAGGVTKKNTISNDKGWNLCLDKTAAGISNWGNCYSASFLRFDSKEARNNLCEFWYENPLMHKLIKGLHKKSGTCRMAIPNINWSKTKNNDNSVRNYQTMTYEQLLAALKEDNPEVK